EHVTWLRTVDQGHARRRGGDKRAWHLKDPYTRGDAPAVEDQSAGQPACRAVCAGDQGSAAEIPTQGRERRLPCGVVVGGGQVDLRLKGGAVGNVLVSRRSGRAAGHRGAWTQPDLARDPAGAGVRDGG